jgi:hypothetical protein
VRTNRLYTNKSYFSCNTMLFLSIENYHFHS